MVNQKKIIYISSLSHSGSTLLDLIIGGHPDFIGLGEIKMSFKSNKLGNICSCGNILEECSFWSKYNKVYNKDLSINNKYKLLFRTFNDIYSDDIIPVDSSKNYFSLKYYLDNGYNVKILRIIKDVRSYSISQINNAIRKGGNRKHRMVLYHFLKWYKENRKFDKFCLRNDLDVFYVSYEQLCLFQEETIKKICLFLNTKYSPDMINIKKSKSHIIKGNRMRNQNKKNTNIMYDNRWFNNNRWLFPFIFFKKIRNYNNRILSANPNDIFKI